MQLIKQVPRLINPFVLGWYVNLQQLVLYINAFILLYKYKMPECHHHQFVLIYQYPVLYHFLSLIVESR